MGRLGALTKQRPDNGGPWPSRSKEADMRLSIFTASVVLTCLSSSPVWAQSSATLDISDVDLFYRLYEATDGRPTAEQIQSGYIDVGSPGCARSSTPDVRRRFTSPRLWSQDRKSIDRPGRVRASCRRSKARSTQPWQNSQASILRLVSPLSPWLWAAAAPSPSAVRSRAHRSGWKPCVQRTSLSLTSRAGSWASWCTNMFMLSRPRV